MMAGTDEQMRRLAEEVNLLREEVGTLRRELEAALQGDDAEDFAALELFHQEFVERARARRKTGRA